MIPDIGIIELCGIVGAICAGLAGPFAVAKWCAGFVERSIVTAVTALEAKLAPATDNLKHKLANTVNRVDGLEHLRVNDIERIVRLEVSTAAIKEGQSRIEHALETMKSEAAAARAEIVDTIREMSKRDVRS